MSGLKKRAVVRQLLIICSEEDLVVWTVGLGFLSRIFGFLMDTDMD